MKHLRKYNENRELTMDVQYLNDCFVDLIDQGATTDYGEEEKHRITWEEFVIEIKLPMHRDYSNSFKTDKVKIDELINTSRKELEIFEEIENCLEKVKIKYPELNNEIITDRKSYWGDNLFEIKVIFRKFKSDDDQY